VFATALLIEDEADVVPVLRILAPAPGFGVVSSAGASAVSAVSATSATPSVTDDIVGTDKSVLSGFSPVRFGGVPEIASDVEAKASVAGIIGAGVTTALAGMGAGGSAEVGATEIACAGLSSFVGLA
jgi:hypothetical protein